MAKRNSLKQLSISKRAAKPRRWRSKLGQGKVSRLLRGKIHQARYLLCLLVVLIIADGLISDFLVRSGLGREGNPFIQGIVGQTSFLSTKVLAALLGGLLLWRVFCRHPKLGRISIIFFVVVYTAILWWNLTMFFIAQA